MDSTIEQRIADVAAKHKAAQWAARQQAAQRQQEDEQTKRVERYRTQRIAQLHTAIDALPARRQQAENQAADADELAAMLIGIVDHHAADYIQRIHGERQSGRPIRLELGSEAAQAFFFGDSIKKRLRQLAMIAGSRNPSAPIFDLESLVTELRNEEKKLKAELAELQQQA